MHVVYWLKIYHVPCRYKNHNHSTCKKVLALFSQCGNDTDVEHVHSLTVKMADNNKQTKQNKTKTTFCLFIGARLEAHEEFLHHSIFFYF